MGDDRLDWDKLRVFRVVAELSSMSAASARLGESPPTIGRKIDDLEASLGVQLLVRSTRGVELTEAGKAVLRYAHTMADAADNVRAQANGTTSSVEGPITISTGDGLGPYWLGPRIAKFQRENPNIQLKLMVREEPHDVLDGETDIAIQFTEPKHHDVVVRRLGVVHYMTFASAAYLQSHDPPGSLFEYYKHRCLLHGSYVNQVERWAPRVSELRKMIDFAMVTNSGTLIIQTCLAGGGLGILPSFIAPSFEELVPLDLPEMAPVQFWLTYTGTVSRMPRGRLVIDWIRSIFEAPDAIWFRDEFVHPRDFKKTVHFIKQAKG